MAGMLEGRIGVVTGAGSGIGRECAVLMAREGASVMCSDISLDGAMGTVQAITDAGGTARMVQTDVSDPEQCRLMVEATVEAFGSLHLAVNNAGIGGEAATVGDYTIDGWRKVLSINLDGVFYSMKYELPEIVKAGGGSIVNISSILGLVGWATASAYTSAKHGVVGLTQTAALEYAAHNIRVNSVNPGFILTPLLTSAGITPGDDTCNFIAAKHAMNRMGTAEEVARAVTWLLSDQASFVTGIPFPVDGGYTAQ
jgi:NAD(P)-dependent dehydrogenase (short-subunit alcohol dehydrogenase family)